MKRIKYSALVLLMMAFGHLQLFSQMSSFNLYDLETNTRIQADKDSIHGFIFGNGGLRSALDGNDDSPVNGSIGFSLVVGKRHEAMMAFTMNELSDLAIENSEQFGRSLVVPDIGGQAFNFHYQSQIRETGFDFQCDFIASRSRMVILENEITSNIYMIRTGAVYRPFREAVLDGGNTIDVGLGAYLNSRFISGPLLLDENRQLLTNELNVNRRDWNSIELIPSFRFNGVEVFAVFPYFFGNSQVENLSGLEFFVGSNITANMFKFKGKK